MGEDPREQSTAQCGLGTMLGWCSLTSEFGLATWYPVFNLRVCGQNHMPSGLSSVFWTIRATGQLGSLSWPPLSLRLLNLRYGLEVCVYLASPTILGQGFSCDSFSTRWSAHPP